MQARVTDWTLVFLAWLLAATSTLGALFLSDVMRLAPCSLCWYQRIFMFSLAVVLAVGLFPLDRGVGRYGLPLAGLGWLFAGGLFYTLGTFFYHRESIRYSHAIWHLFVIGGSVCHFVAVTKQVL